MIGGIQWNTKSVLITVVTGIVIVYAGYNMWQSQDAGAEAGAKHLVTKKVDSRLASDNAVVDAGAKSKGASAASKSKTTSGMKTFPNVILKDFEVDKGQAVPADLMDKAKNDAVTVEEKEIKIEIAQAKYTVFYREVPGSPDKVPLLLLHGMAFTSKNWVDIKTMQIVSRMGHRVVAVDLPGYGKTSGRGLQDKAKFLNTFIGALGLGHPIIVSPSMSGSFSLPFVMGKFTHTPSGFIPVAPVHAADYTDAYKNVKIPVLIVYGSKDERMGAGGAKHLKHFPNSQVHVVKDAGHPCYLDQPGDWHKTLYNFLRLFDQK